MNATPLLPLDTVQYLALHLGWGLVLAAGLVWLLRRRGLRARSVQAAVTVIAIGWNLLSGALASASPAYWLGLAFQAPSLVTSLLCLWYLLHGWREQPSPPVGAPLRGLCVAGIMLGWVLVLDMLAWLPWSLYAAGFQPWVTAVLAAAALLPWIVQGRAALQDGRNWVVPIAVLLFVVTRGPNGNAWDAVLDPLLWLALHAAVPYRAAWKRIF